MRTGPSCAKAAAIPSSTLAGSSIRMPRIPMASAIAAKFGFLSSVPKSRHPVDFCSSSTKPSAPLLNTTTFTNGDLDRGGHASRKDDTSWHLIDMDTNRNALGQTHPREDGVD